MIDDQIVILERSEVANTIPHRNKWLLLNEVQILKQSEKAIGKMDVVEGEWYVDGHFPDQAVLPGVIIVEAMAQTAAVCSLYGTNTSAKAVYFMKIMNTSFRKPVIPNVTLFLEVELQRKIGAALVFSCIGRTELGVVAQAEIMATVGK